jgi:Histidine kinase-, DNA gyrase B-, and HSP90-like ATPase/IclR helix-turn-helix domain
MNAYQPPRSAPPAPVAPPDSSAPGSITPGDTGGNEVHGLVGTGLLGPGITEPPRIAVYAEPHSPPTVVPVTDYPTADEHLPALLQSLAERAHGLARDQGGRLPLAVFRELVDNLVHASFAGVVITILDRGNTVRISDRGPGIPDKEAALRPGFTSADARAKRFIRGVGSGFSMVKEILAGMDGALLIEDNLGRGTVVTAHVSPVTQTPLASTAIPAYNLSERQLKTLLLTVELAPVGPTRIAQELGVSTSTAFRDLVSLEDAGFVSSRATGHRSVTEAGLAYLDSVL